MIVSLQFLELPIIWNSIGQAANHRVVRVDSIVKYTVSPDLRTPAAPEPTLNAFSDHESPIRRA